MATNYLINGAEFSDNFIPKDAFTTGGLWVWGNNYYGTLGNGGGGSVPLSASKYLTPVISANFRNWKTIASGQAHSGGIKTDGTLWMWGRNHNGQLGDGTTTNRGAETQIGSSTNWKEIDGGYGHFTLAIKTDGTLWSWGQNDYGQLGISDTTNRSSPVQITGTNWKIMSCGALHSSAIKTDGTLWTWGRATSGELGDNTTTGKSTPVQVAGTIWKMVCAGGYQTAAIKTDGTLWTWGRNNYGQLGVGDSTNRSSPTQVSGTTWKQVSCSDMNLAAIKTDGTLWTCGFGAYGGNGDGTTTDRSSPVQTSTMSTNWKSVQDSKYGFNGIKTDGTLWVWGYGFNAQIGDNDTSTRSVPTQIGTATNWKLASGGNYSVVAIREDF